MATLFDQVQFEDKCHEDAFKGTDHLSRSVHTQLIPAFIEQYDAWLNTKSAGKAGKLRGIMREAVTPKALIASNMLKTVFELEGQEVSTLVHKLTKCFMVEEEYQDSMQAIQKGNNKKMADRVAFQMQNKPTHASRMEHLQKTRSRLTNIGEFDKKLYAGVGALMLDIASSIQVYTQGVTFNVFLMEAPFKEYNSQNRPRTSRRVVFTADFNKWFGLKVHNVQASAFSLKPTLIKPNKWEDLVGGGYYSQRGNLHWQFIRNADLRLYKASDVPAELYEAVNAIQETPWKINSKVLSIMNWCLENNFPMGGLTCLDTKIGKKERRDVLRNRIPKDEWDLLTLEDRIKFTKERDAKTIDTARQESKYDKVKSQVAMAQEFSKYNEVFFPHAVDFRGRIYPIPCAVNPQADKIGQALLQLAHGEALGEDGRFFLAVQGANTFGNDKVSFEDRVAFIEGKSEEIKEIALNPLKTREIWSTCSEPWAYLSFCFEWAEMLAMSDHTKYVSHTAVKLDATCSGLQHYSAMLLDPKGALATNIGNNSDRQDIYIEAKDATKGLIFDELVSLTDPVEKNWKRSFIDTLTRNVAKNPCMTLPYGVSTFGITDTLVLLERDGDFKEAYIEEGSNAKDKLLKLRWLAQQLEQGVADTVPSAVDAMGWLKACDKIVCKSLPSNEYYEFPSPIGFMVKQARLKETTKRFKSYFGDTKLRVDMSVSVKSTDYNKAKSNTSISPNFIHAQDASHLTNVALRAKRELGLKSYSFIHDSFGVHPSETGAFLKVIKEEFHQLYSGNRLVELKTYLEERYHVELPVAPTQGSFDINTVLDSKFIFS